MKTLTFDSETTGVADFKLPASDPSHPHLVQIGAILYDDDWSVRSELNLIVNPGVDIPIGASNIHHITNDVAKKFGVTPYEALYLFLKLTDMADEIVAHNIQFDNLVIAANCYRNNLTYELRDRGYCTMRATTNICKIPSSRGFKWPKLQEAHKFAFGEEFSQAHDAMADVRACGRVYKWLKDTNQA